MYIHSVICKEIMACRSGIDLLKADVFSAAIVLLYLMRTEEMPGSTRDTDATFVCQSNNTPMASAQFNPSQPNDPRPPELDQPSLKAWETIIKGEDSFGRRVNPGRTRDEIKDVLNNELALGFNSAQLSFFSRYLCRQEERGTAADMYDNLSMLF